ncbi:MAG: DUF2802 domain-containing protein [Gammaproteobacteria bacterium]|nr:DUF2802 domain-containing protein [Gammaproteobacteria bacterium]
MNILESYALYLLIVSNALLAAAAAIAVIRFRRQCLRLEHFWNSPTGAALADKASEQERQQLLVNKRLDRRLSDVQKKLRTITATERNSSAPSERQLPIDNAIRMAKNGASVEELTRNCGLNIGEAQLMLKMHAKTLSAVNA